MPDGEGGELLEMGNSQMGQEEFGMTWPDFDEFETPIDLSAAIDGD